MVIRQAPIICVMAPSIHLGAWSMALMITTFLHVYLVETERDGEREDRELCAHSLQQV